MIYNGINERKLISSEDPELNKSLGIEKDTMVLGTVARLDAIKNQKMLIEAFKIINEKYPNTKLLLIGDGPMRNELETLTKELSLTHDVIFTGSTNEAYRYYNIMDVFVLTSMTEGTAMTLLEAMASSTPCIVTDAGGNPEIVKDGETGFIIPVNDTAALAEKIEILLNKAELAMKMGQAGRTRFRKFFTVEKMIQSYQELYQE